MSEQKYHQTLTANRKLLAENERLKADVKRLTSIIDINTDDKGRNLLALTNENARLAADIKRLAADTLKDLSLIEELKAENERLVKAGDAVCESPYLLETDPAVLAWRTAKEGKRS